jgi:transcriptional regulator with XRE-family HTH domain|nr:helix-turn-helix transcriptional regulator [Providencia rettgeri]ELR5259460.1 helix-turn-helix transcriptional regulator [Providencia rettgeri]
MGNTECLSSIAGNELKKLRIDAGYTQGQFSKLINKSGQQLFGYEQCISKIDIGTLINSSIVLDVDIASFFTKITAIYNKEEVSLYAPPSTINIDLNTNAPFTRCSLAKVK